VAVYTVLSKDELSSIAAAFGLGPLRGAEGIPHGSINTNFRLQTGHGTCFLRHSTVRSSEDLRFEAALLAHLVEGGYPAPVLLWTTDNQPFLEIAGGRASVFRQLAGEELSRADLTADHCERVGAAVGKLHRVGNSFSQERANPYGPGQVRNWLAELSLHPDPGIRVLGEELLPLLEYSQQFQGGLLPRGAIHADLFMDNVKWVGDKISAVFDFEMACRDAFALDLAIAVNAWCFDRTYQPVFCRAVIRGYRRQRSLESVEIDAVYFQALFGAVRYSASRIRDFHLSTLPPERLARKDYRTYLNRARALREMGPAGFKELLGLARS
jgi:homoserine kinase type II